MKRKLKAVTAGLSVVAAIMLVTLPGFGQFKAAMETGQVIQPKVSINQSTYRGIVFSPDGKGVWLSAGNAASLWDIETGEMKVKFEYHSSDRPDWHMDPIESLALSPDGKSIASGDQDGVLKIWDPETGQVKSTAKLKLGGGIKSVSWSPDGSVVAAAGFYDSLIKLVDPASGSVKGTIEVSKQSGLRAITYSPDGKLLATYRGGNKVMLFDAKTGNPRKTLEIPEKVPGRSYQDAECIAFSPDSKTLATGGGHTGYLLDVATGRVRATLPHEAREDQEDKVLGVAFSPDGKLVATACMDGIAKLWDATTGKVKATLKGEHPYFNMVAFSPDGRKVLVGGSDSTKLFEVPGK